MPTDLRSLAQSNLQPGEALLWAGRPDPKRMALRTVGSFVFGVIWMAFQIHFVWNWLNFSSRGISGFRYDWDLPMLLFSIPFFVIGFVLLLTPAWTYLKALRTIYAITDKRVLIIVTGMSRSIQSYTEKDIGLIARVERANGSGDVLFSQKTSETNDGRFVGIPDVRSVEAMLEGVFKHR